MTQFGCSVGLPENIIYLLASRKYHLFIVFRHTMICGSAVCIDVFNCSTTTFGHYAQHYMPQTIRDHTQATPVNSHTTTLFPTTMIFALLVSV